MKSARTTPSASRQAPVLPALYVHVPYCARKCEYCAFNSAAGRSRSEQERYVSALLRETEKALEHHGRAISSIYIGGGTPTELEPSEFKRLLEGIGSQVDQTWLREWTVEANPGTLTQGHVEALCSAGVDRVSMGVQSMDQERLEKLGRVHGVEDVRESVRVLRKAGIQRINLDLIYGQPWQDEKDWLQDLELLLELEPEHLSAYALQFEEGTPFFEALRQGKMTTCPEDMVRRMFSLGCERLDKAGFKLYEISNFCREGQESVHNLNYWRNLEYYGLGAGAWGRIGNRRTRNLNSPLRYIEAIEAGRSAVEEEDLLGPREDWMECLTSGLRTAEGVNLRALDERTGFHTARNCKERLLELKQAGLLHDDAESLRLTHDGLWLLDSILLKLFEAWPKV